MIANNANLNKWVDELQGQVDDLRRDVAKIIKGIEVSYEPSVESGVALGTLMVGVESSTIFAPEVSYTPTIESGELIGTLQVGPESSQIFTPTVETDTVTRPADLYSSTAIARVYKIFNKIAIISFKGVLSEAVTGNGGLLFTLPSGFRPSSQKTASCYTAYNDVAGFYNVAVNTDGTVKTSIGSGTVTGTICFEAGIFLL